MPTRTARGIGALVSMDGEIAWTGTRLRDRAANQYYIATGFGNGECHLAAETTATASDKEALTIEPKAN